MASVFMTMTSRAASTGGFTGGRVAALQAAHGSGLPVTSRNRASSLGKTWTTSVLRLISRLTPSSWLVDWIFFQCRHSVGDVGGVMHADAQGMEVRWPTAGGSQSVPDRAGNHGGERAPHNATAPDRIAWLEALACGGCGI